MYDINQLKKIFFIGIGGIGVSALARMMVLRGIDVSGSDLKLSEITDSLEELGVTIYGDQQGDHITDDLDLIVKTAAVKENSETLRAKELGIPVVDRGVFLAWIANEYRLIAIAGSHGKTTTTGMTTYLLQQYGEVSYNIGGVLLDFNKNAHIGDTEFFVTESDESDGTFLHLNPEIAILNNLDPEHLDHYGTYDVLKEAFIQFSKGAQKTLYCKDDPDVREIIALGEIDGVSFSIDQDADYRGEIIAEHPFSTDVVIHYRGKQKAITVPIPGKHNVRNALASFGALDLVGIELEPLKLKSFKGVKRRLECLYNKNGLAFYDDYAHHPEEMKALWNGLKGDNRRKIVLFQPHRYSRTRDHFDQIVTALGMFDHLILLKEYAASEVVIPEATAERLYEKLDQSTFKYLSFAPTVEAGIETLKRIIRRNDLVLSIGAGSVNQVLYGLKAQLEAKEAVIAPFLKLPGTRAFYPLNQLTTINIGGIASTYGAPNSQKALMEMISEASDPVVIVGRGSNLVFSDGFHDKTVLSLQKIKTFKICGDGCYEISAGTSLRDIYQKLKNRCGDIAYLATIPGTLGGGLITNAGAYGFQLGDHLISVTLLIDGDIIVRHRSELEIEYRRIGNIDGVILGATFRFNSGNSIENDQMVAQYQQQRGEKQPLKFPNCGSVFKNPTGDYAARLIEAAGLKGAKIGGIEISAKHANFMTNHGGAFFADFKKAVTFVQRSVQEQFQIELTLEVNIIE